MAGLVAVAQVVHCDIPLETLENRLWQLMQQDYEDTLRQDSTASYWQVRERRFDRLFRSFGRALDGDVLRAR